MGTPGTKSVGGSVSLLRQPRAKVILVMSGRAARCTKALSPSRREQSVLRGQCLRQCIALLTTLYQYAYWLKWIIQGIATPAGSSWANDMRSQNPFIDNSLGQDGSEGSQQIALSQCKILEFGPRRVLGADQRLEHLSFVQAKATNLGLQCLSFLSSSQVVVPRRLGLAPVASV